jgi:osmotically-inducible protein OsmY
MDEFEAVKKKAASILSRRYHTKKELADKLKRANYNEHIIADVLEWAAQYGFVDDCEYARLFITDAINIKKHGRRRIAQALSFKGIEHDGESIRLSGTVPYYSGLVNAFRDAFAASGGRDVVSRLTVDFPGDAVLPPDEMLEMNIRSLVDLLSWLQRASVTVRVARRLVYLTGRTEYLWQKRKLERIIGEFKGVAGISNDIEVVTGGDLPDRRVAEDVHGSLERITGLDSSSIKVNVVHGRVFLEGKVRDPLEMTAVERVVAFTRGVTDVVNNLAMR